MGIFDFFKKKKEEPKINKIKLEDLENWIKDKKSVNQTKEEIFYRLLNEKILNLIKELEEQLLVIQKIDVGKKKVEEKAKLIIKENLNNYIFYLKKLINDLKDIKIQNPYKLMEETNSILYNFEKRSHMSFEKATFIIGNELGKIKESIDKFFEDFKKVIKENEPLTVEIKPINFLESKIIEIKNLDKLNENSKVEIINYQKKLIELESNIKNFEKEIEKIKKTVEYIEEINKKENFIRKKQELDKEIYKIKEQIDFKNLAAIYHSDKNKMIIINNYKNNFKESFLKDNAEGLFNIFKELNQNKDIINTIREIQFLNQEINSTVEDKTEQNKVLILESQVKKIVLEINGIKEEISKEGKKQEKFISNKNEIINLIKQESLKVNLEII